MELCHRTPLTNICSSYYFARPYYPFVGKTFEGTVGQTNPVPGGVVYLPLVPAATLKSVSARATTTVEFPASVLAGRPELAGVKIMVPPNSLFADDGTRGGSVGIPPVPPDRIPSPLPPGLTPPIVITVQTDGPANFDQPVPVQFPNLPDPGTGKVLAPGERSILWSFNHDSGQWEPQGTMTVSADGKFLVSDPGVGILQPGWHAAAPVGQPTPPPNNCKGNNLTLEYLEWQLKQAECMVRAAAVLGSPVGSGLQAMVGVAGQLPGLASSLNSLKNAVLSGQPAAALRATVGVLDKSCSALGAVLNRANPQGKIEDLIKCLLEMVKEQLDFTCQIVPCVTGSNSPQVAKQVATCNAIQQVINQLLNGARAYSQISPSTIKSPFDEMCKAIGSLGKILAAAPSGPASNSNRSVGLASLPVDTQQQILKELDAALAMIPELENALMPTVTLAASMMEGLDVYSNHLELVDGPLLLRLNAHANSYYKLTSGTFVTRGQTTASGALNLPMIGLSESYSLLIYDPLRNAVSEGVAPAPGVLNGAQSVLPDPTLRIPGINDLSGDTDGDGLTDLAEDVIGTRRDAKDTDGDGASDFAEVQQGGNPLSGIAFPVGPVSALPLAGFTKSIDLADTTAYLAQGRAGMAVVDLDDPLKPILVSQFALPGDSYDIAYSTTARTAGLVASASDEQIAQGELSQIHFVDLVDPARPRLIRNALIRARFIEEHSGIFYVAVENEIRMYDAASGLEIGGFSVKTALGLVSGAFGAIDRASGLLVTESEIFLTVDDKLAIFQKGVSAPVLKGRVSGRFAAADVFSKVDMVIDGTRLWVGTAQGLLAVDISNRTAPKLLNQPGNSPRAIRASSLSAARRVIALSTPAPDVNAGGQISIYDVSDPTSTNRLGLVLNGRGRAQDAALLSGWVVLADWQAGLTVMNILSPDFAGQAPAITWPPVLDDFDPAKSGVQMVEGQVATFRTTVTDDVEVDFSELIVDGSVVDSSRVIPPVFEYELPILAAGANQVDVQIQSRDRSGNLSLTERVVVELVADTVPPTPLNPTAQSGFAAFSNWPLVFRFSEDLLPSAWHVGAMTLLSFGADHVVGGGDDAVIPLASGGVVGSSASIVPAAPLGFGRYRLTIPKEQIRDLASNAAPSDLVFEFDALAADPSNSVWVSRVPGRYHDAANWFPRRVSAQEDVLILQAGSTPAVTLDQSVLVRNLTINGTLTIAGRFTSLTVRNSLRGFGTITGNIELGSFLPCSLVLDQAGTSLIIDGNLTLGSDATFSPVLGLAPGPSVVEVKRQTVLNGILKPTLAPGYMARKGDAFVIGKFHGSVNGNFTQLDPGAMGAGVIFEGTIDGVNLTVRITGP